LPAPYLRQRSNGLWEHGVGHFIFPSPRGIESQEFPFRGAYDNQFGHGATTMFERFVLTFMGLFRESPIKPPPYIGTDVRPRLQLSSLAMNFMAVGRYILCTRPKLREDEDVAWNILAVAGITEVYHLPLVPMGIHSAELPETKGFPLARQAERMNSTPNDHYSFTEHLIRTGMKSAHQRGTLPHQVAAKLNDPNTTTQQLVDILHESMPPELLDDWEEFLEANPHS
jgi:hypothetical protein